MELITEAFAATSTMTVHDAEIYWEILYNSIPLSIVGGLTAMIMNLNNIMSESSWLKRIAGAVCVVLVGGVAAGVAALGLGLFIASPKPEIQIVASAIAGSTGQRLFDIYGHKIFGRYFCLFEPWHREKEDRS